MVMFQNPCRMPSLSNYWNSEFSDEEEMELEEEQHQPPTVKPSLVRSSKKNYKEKRFNLSGWGTT